MSEDCLLAAKRTMYAVEYRRFYLRDLECILVWPSRLWLWRLIIPGALFTALGAALWEWLNSTSGAIFIGIGVAWVVLELALGPTARSNVRTTGVAVDLPLVKRTRRASKILSVIDAAVRASRDVTIQTVSVPTLKPAGVSVETNSYKMPAASSVVNGSRSNDF